MHDTFNREAEPEEARIVYSSGSVRSADTERERYDLIPPAFMRALALRYGHGAAKYGDNNWMLGQPYSAVLRHAAKHLQALATVSRDGTYDGETFQQHAAAVAWAMATLIHFADYAEMSKYADLDDRPYAIFEAQDLLSAAAPFEEYCI